MLYIYKAMTEQGEKKQGEIEAQSPDSAVRSLQQRGLIVVSVDPADKKSFLKQSVPFFDKVKMKDIVIMSRQASAMFESQVPAVKTFNLLAENVESVTLKNILQAVSQDIQGGVPISDAMAKHPSAFSEFYVNMVRAGEESGKLTDTFIFLADYLERQYELISKTRNALIYPVFVIVAFIAVMVLMMTLVIPRLSEIILASGQDIPIYTKVVIGISNFLVDYGVLILIVLAVVGFFFWRSSKTEKGKLRIDSMKITLPYFGDLYRKMYLSRIADNMDTMISSGIPMVRVLEITADVVDNRVYRQIMSVALGDVKAGNSISDSFAKHEEIPQIMIAMIRVGEETGSLGSILKTLARFYKREVSNAVDTLIGLIEPAMIIGLGIGVGFLLTSILVPIYNIAGSI